MTQQELGDLLGMSASMVSAVEKGRRAFAGDLTVLGYAQHRLALPDMSDPLHRHRASTAVAAKNRAHELLRLSGEVFAELRELTPRAPEILLDRHAAPMTVDEVDDLAADTRAALGHEERGPIQNLTNLVERSGVCVVPIVGLDGIDGLSAWVDGVPVIGLSPAVPGDRFRLTLGHELGHLLFHSVKGANTEAEANRFAVSLLFPPAEFEAAMPDRPQLRDFVALKASWGVSVAALVYRAHDLGYIDDARYRALQIQMSKWRRTEPGMFDPALGSLFGRLVEANGGRAEVARSLGVNERHLAGAMSWSHLRVA
jgi:Zn-dependent peptidase ImmA (M78 family)/transcriptional regulator with XRE-family HTH domain